MDIAKAQADGQARAAKFLEANPVMIAEAPAPVTEVAKPAEAPAVVAPAAVTPVPAKPGMADAIRADRENRQRAAQEKSEATKYKEELANTKKELEALRTAQNLRDPLEFARNRNMTKEEQALWGQALLYDLKPEVAPPEFRLEIYKAQQARERAEEARTAQEARANEERERTESVQREQQQRLAGFAADLEATVKSLPAGSNPESETWFTEESPDGTANVNHAAYVQSLLATANNLANAAAQRGQVADLSPANVARVLEAEVAKRMKRRDARMAGSAKTTGAAPKTASGEPATSALSTKTLGGGAPQPPDTSDAARKARAAAVLWGTK